MSEFTLKLNETSAMILDELLATYPAVRPEDATAVAQLRHALGYNTPQRRFQRAKDEAWKKLSAASFERLTTGDRVIFNRGFVAGSDYAQSVNL